MVQNNPHMNLGGTKCYYAQAMTLQCMASCSFSREEKLCKQKEWDRARRVPASRTKVSEVSQVAARHLSRTLRHKSPSAATLNFPARETGF